MLALAAGTWLGCAAPAVAHGQAGRLADAAKLAPRAPAFLSLREHSARLPLLRRVVAVELQAVPLRTALERIARLGGLRLTYSADILPRERVVSLSAGRITTADALLTVLADTGLDVLISTDADAVVVRYGRALRS